MEQLADAVFASTNPDGLLTRSVNRHGQEIAYDYNNNYQVNKETRSDGSIIEYGYTETGVLFAYIGDNTGRKTTQFSYDQSAKKINIDNSVWSKLNYSFDELGREKFS